VRNARRPGIPSAHDHRLIAGISMRHQDDENRLSEGGAVFDSLYEYYKRKR